MRQIGVLPDAFQARALADYLLTLRIETRVEQQPEGCVVWACDEDRVAQARQEFDTFRKEPRAPRYAAAAGTAAAIRREEDEIEEDYDRRQTQLRELLAEPAKPRGGKAFTFALSSIAFVVAFLTKFGDEDQKPLMQALFIAPFHIKTENGNELIVWNRLSNVAHGEIWRLVTPIFIHLTFVHLLFNVLMLNYLGGAFEERRGPIRFLLFVLVAAVVSNLAQYYLGWVSHVSKWSEQKPNPGFGGLSGVVYALFGYVWMKSRFEPQLGFVVSTNQVVIMVGFFLLCFTGGVGPVANVCHAAGFGVGLVVGVAPTVWRNLFGGARPSEPRT